MPWISAPYQKRLHAGLGVVGAMRGPSIGTIQAREGMPRSQPGNRVVAQPESAAGGSGSSEDGLFLKTARPPEMVSGGRVLEGGTLRGFFGRARPYWQDSQVPPLRIASIEQAARSASVGSLAGRRSREALSMELLLSVRK